jgi:ethanolamine utilization protein EutP (predicted NTPase)
MRHLIFILIVLSFTPAEGADKEAKAEGNKKVTYRKTQEVNFDGADIDGQVRSPDGAYLLQKRGVRFMPLYKVNNQFEKNILESVEYLR